MRQTFVPQDLIVMDGMVAAVIGNGSGFVYTNTGEQIYVPSRQIAVMNVDVGDGVRCWCFHNDPEHQNTAKYRSVRSMVTYRIADQINAPVNAMAEALVAPYSAPEGSPGTEVAETQTTPPATSFPAVPKAIIPLDGAKLETAVATILDRSGVFSTKDVHAMICEERPEQWGDTKLLTRITNALNVMHSNGEVGAIKVYREAGQTSASAVLYARSVELALRIMSRGL
jgi:hypothetical protein